MFIELCGAAAALIEGTCEIDRPGGETSGEAPLIATTVFKLRRDINDLLGSLRRWLTFR